MRSPPIKYVPDAIELQFKVPSVISIEQPSLDAAFYPSDKELCRLAYLVYKSPKELERILAAEEKFDGWTLLATGKSKSFFQTYRGAAFWHQGKRQLVISHPGTNSGGDVLTDIKGCILNQYTIPLDMACTFAALVLENTNNYENMQNCSISITGHSLGAWFAQISAFSIEYLTVRGDHFANLEIPAKKYHPHTVVFDNPGAEETLSKISQGYFPLYEHNVILDLDMTTYFTKPNKINCKNRHAGKLLCFIDFEITEFKKDSFFKWLAPYTVNYHEIKSFLDCFDGSQRIVQILDWPKYEIKNSFFHLITGSRKGEQQKYDTFVVRERHSYIEILNENKEYIRIRFKIKDLDNTLDANIFTEDEFIFLENWKQLKSKEIIPVEINKFLNDNSLGSFDDFLPNFEIQKSAISAENKAALEKIGNRIKRLFIQYPVVCDVMKEQILVAPEVFEAIYKARMDQYIETLPKYEISFNDTIGLATFLNNKDDPILIFNTENTKDEAFRIRNILLKKTETKENEYSLFSHKDMKYIEKCVNVAAIFQTPKYTLDNVLIIDFEDQTDFTILNRLTTSNGTTKKIIAITKKPVPGRNDNNNLVEATLNNLSEDSLTHFRDQNVISLNGSQFKLERFLGNKGSSNASHVPFNALKDCLDSKQNIEINFQNDRLNKIYLNLSTVNVLKDVKIEHLGKILQNYDSTLKPTIGKTYENVKFFITGVNENQALMNENQALKILLENNFGGQIHLDDSVDQEKSLENFQNECLKSPGKTIFRLHMSDPKSDKLTWLDVFDPNLYIKRKFRNPEVNEKEIILTDEKVFLISNNAGMGKSNTLLNIAKSLQDSWIFWINCIDIHEHIDMKTSIDEDIFVKFLLKTGKNSSKLAQVLLKFSLKNLNSVPVYLFFDGFDEIQDTEKIKREVIRSRILSILKFLKNTSAKIFISTREHERETLEKELNMIGKCTKLQEIDEKEQIEFCMKFWMLKTSLFECDPHENKKRMNAHVQDILRRLKSSIDSHTLSLLGIPLQLRMIAEIFHPDNVQPDTNFNLLDLYQKFVNQKYDIYFKEKMCFTPDAHKNLLQPLFQEAHRNLGMSYLFPDLSSKIDCKKLIYLNRVGLVQINGTTVSFIHRTFAEFFAAELFVYWMENDPDEKIQIFLVKNLFRERNYAIIQRFISDALAVSKKGSKILQFYPKIWSEVTQVSVLDDDWEEYNTLMSSKARKLLEFVMENFKYSTSAKNDFLNSRKGRGTMLYEAIRWQDPGLALFLVECGANFNFIKDDEREHDDFWTNEIDGNFISPKLGELGEIIYYLASKNKFNSISLKLIEKGEFDEIAEANLWDMADCYNNRDLFFDGFRLYQNNDVFLNKWGVKIFCNAVENDRVDLALKLIDKKIEISNENIHCPKYGKWNLIKMYLNNAEPDNYEKGLIETLQFISMNGDIWSYIIQLKDKNSKNATSPMFLHFAIAQDRIDAANDLLSKEDVNATDEDGKTPIILAAERKHWEFILAALDLDRVDFTLLKENETNFIHLACKQNQTEAILKILDTYKEFLNIRDDNGDTPILIAAENEHWELVSKLRERGADISIANNLNKTLAHFACEKNQKDLALDLIKNNKNCLSIPDSNGSTPLLHAAKNGHWDLIEEVIEKSKIDEMKFSELNKPNKLHETLLQLACKDNKDKVALKLITLNDFNAEISDENGQTILHLFCQNNQILLTLEIIKKRTGKDIDYPDKKGKTPALLAAEKGHWTLINTLIGSEFLDLETSKHRNDFVKLSIRDNEMELALKLINKDNINSPIDDYDNTPALLAAKQGHWGLVRKLMKFTGFNHQKQQNKDREVLLHFACRSNEIELALQLVNEDNINYPDKHGNTPGLLAAEKGHWDLVKMLIKKKGFEIGQTGGVGFKTSLLYFACKCNNVDLVFELIEKKGHVNLTNEFCSTPIEWAAQYGHWDLVIKLMKYKVKQGNFTYSEIREILGYAYKENKADLVHELTKKQNLDMDSRECLWAAKKRSWEIVKILMNYKNFEVKGHNYKKETLLHFACQDNKKELVFELIKRGANVNFADDDGDTPVLRAARSGHFDLVTEIFEDSYVNYKNKYNKTLLHFACQHNKTDFALHLLKKGADIHIEDNEKNTAILIAAGNGHWDLVLKLIDNYAHVYNVNVFKETLLHLACRDNQETLAQNLINIRLDVNCLNTYKRSPIFFAAENSHWDLVQKLIELNADPNIPDKDGTTVLHFACRDGREDIALLLIRKGADPIATDTYGISPLDLANRNEHNNLVEEILNLDKEDE